MYWDDALLLSLEMNAFIIELTKKKLSIGYNLDITYEHFPQYPKALEVTHKTPSKLDSTYLKRVFDVDARYTCTSCLKHQIHF